MSIDLNQDLSKLMQEAQKMQQKMQLAQEEIGNLRIEGRAGGNHPVIATMNGRHDVLSLKIHPELLKQNINIIEEVITAALNDAVRKLERESQNQINKLTSGLNLPIDDKS